MIAFPIPVPGGVPPWVSVLFALVAVAGFAVVVLQTVRWFRANRDDDSEGHRHDPTDPPST